MHKYRFVDLDELRCSEDRWEWKHKAERALRNALTVHYKKGNPITHYGSEPALVGGKPVISFQGDSSDWGEQTLTCQVQVHSSWSERDVTDTVFRIQIGNMDTNCGCSHLRSFHYNPAREGFYDSPLRNVITEYIMSVLCYKGYIHWQVSGTEEESPDVLCLARTIPGHRKLPFSGEHNYRTDHALYYYMGRVS